MSNQKTNFLLFKSLDGTRVNLSLYHLSCKKAIRIIEEDDEIKIIPLSLATLSQEIDEGISIQIPEKRVEKKFQPFKKKNPFFLRDVEIELDKTQRALPKRALEHYHELITNAKETRVVKSSKLDETCFIFFIHSPNRGGGVLIRVYHTELQRAVTISNDKDVSAIGIRRLCDEIRRETTKPTEVHHAEEYLSNKDLMTKVLSCCKRQSLETSDFSNVTEGEFHQIILNAKKHSLMGELELVDSE